MVELTRMTFLCIIFIFYTYIGFNILCSLKTIIIVVSLVENIIGTQEK